MTYLRVRWRHDHADEPILIAAQGEFEPEEITRDEFERIWSTRRF